MPYCPTCRSEYKSGFSECADCKVPLVDSLPDGPSGGTTPAGPQSFEVVYRAVSPADVEVVRVRLEQEGIPAVVDESAMATHAFELGTGGVGLRVPQEHAARAREVLAARTAEQEPSPKPKAAEDVIRSLGLGQFLAIGGICVWVFVVLSWTGGGLGLDDFGLIILPLVVLVAVRLFRRRTSPPVAPPAAPDRAGPGAEAEPAPPKRRFAGPLLFWFFVFVLPLEFAADMLATYVHEFAHGLAALATGGHFLGVKGQFFVRDSPVMAFADAWSDEYDVYVFLAGIAVTVVLGLASLAAAFRLRPILARLALFLLAVAFFSDLGYALEGCMLPEGGAYDTARVLDEFDVPALRWGSGTLIGVSLLAASLVLGRGLFRAWEDVFGDLTGGQAFWVVLFLANPVPFPSPRSEAFGPMILATGALFIGVTTWLIRSRRASVTPAPLGRFLPWGVGVWMAALVAGLGVAWLEQGIDTGTYRETVVTDLALEDRTVAGYRATYGMGDRYERRPVEDSPMEVFVATGEGSDAFRIRDFDVLDVAWVSSIGRIVGVSSWGVFQLDPSDGKVDWLWKAGRYKVDTGYHGPDGAVVAILESKGYGPQSWDALYVYDAVRKAGAFYEAPDTPGTPFFLPGSPVKVLVTVGPDLWEFTWTGKQGDAPGLTRHAGDSGRGWLAGQSGRQRWWWTESSEWVCGDTRLTADGIDFWGAGSEGFTTISSRGDWRLTTPAGWLLRRGRIRAREVSFLHFHEGIPWVVFRNGAVRRLEDAEASFSVRLPK